MILKELSDYGMTLVKRGVLPPFGWSLVSASYALEINAEGELTNILDLRTEKQYGKKTVKAPLSCAVPFHPTHTASTGSALVLCDNLTYLMGVAGEGDDPVKAAARNRALIALHHEIFDGVQSEKSKALLAFLDRYKGTEADDDVFDPYREMLPELSIATNIVLVYAEDGSFLHEDEKLAEAWNQYYQKELFEGADTVTGECSETGMSGPIARTHALTRGFPGAKATGAALVSFNLPSVDWFGKQQGYSAPVSAVCSLYYTSALQYLVRSPYHHKSIGDMTLLFWAQDETPEELESKVMSMTLYGQQKTLYDSEADESLYHAVNAMLAGAKPVEEFSQQTVSLTKNFYFLGLMPHSARLAPVFFQKDTMEGYLKNVKQHCEDCTIISRYGTYTPTLYDLINAFETPDGRTPLNAKEQEALLSAVLQGSRYPQFCLNGMLNRIARDKTFSPENPARAAILKAFLIRNGKDSCKEAATMILNQENQSEAYVLGRIFNLLVGLQTRAMGELNSGFKDNLAGAATYPKRTFPSLLKKTPHYFKILQRDESTRALGLWFERQLAELLDRVPIFPTKLTDTEQAEFMLGYYHAQAEKYSTKNN